MRIGVLTSVGRTLDAFFVEITQCWEAAGHAVFWAAGTSPTAAHTFDRIDGLTQRPSLGNVHVPGRLADWCRDRELDVVVTNTATASLLARVRRLPVPLVYFCHGLHWNTGRHPAQVLEHITAPRAAAIITINSDDRSWFEKRHPRVWFLEQGVGVPDADYPWTPMPADDGDLRLLWAGDFVPRKRPEHAVEVVRHLRSLQYPVRLTMLGDGPGLESVRAEAAKLGDAITLPGRARVQPYIASSHALLHTAEWEGLPRILLEGMVMGRPAFAYDVKGVRDVPHARLASRPEPDELAQLIAGSERPRVVDPSSVTEFRTPAVAAWLLEHLEQVLV